MPPARLSDTNYDYNRSAPPPIQKSTDGPTVAPKPAQIVQHAPTIVAPPQPAPPEPPKPVPKPAPKAEAPKTAPTK